MHFRKKGFTLIELLVVIAIIGILASIVLSSVNTLRAKGRDAKRIADMRNIRNALEAYYGDNNRYPSPQQDLSNANCLPTSWDCSNCDGPDPVLNCGVGHYSFIPALVAGNYISQVPVDPINNLTYHYAYFRTTGTIYNCPNDGRGKYVIGIKKFESIPGYINPNFCGPGVGVFEWADGRYEN